MLASDGLCTQDSRTREGFVIEKYIFAPHTHLHINMCSPTHTKTCSHAIVTQHGSHLQAPGPSIVSHIQRTCSDHDRRTHAFLMMHISSHEVAIALHMRTLAQSTRHMISAHARMHSQISLSMQAHHGLPPSHMHEQPQQYWFCFSSQPNVALWCSAQSCLQCRSNMPS